MVSAITYGEGLENIHKSFHPTFRRILNTRIQNDENILLVAEATRVSKYREDYGKRKWRRVSHSCIITITNHRWIRAGMGWSGMADSIAYRTIGSRVGSWFGEGDFYTHYWEFPPKRLPNAKELGKKELHERTNEYIREVPLSTLEEIRTRNNFSFMFQNQKIEIVEITFQRGWIAFKAADGNRVYELIQIAQNNDGFIPLTPTEEDNATSKNTLVKLRELKTLLDESLITEQDYEAKKKELLSQI